MSVSRELGLESPLADLENGDHATMLAEVLIYNEGKHLCRTAINRHIFQTDIVLTKGVPTFTVLDGRFHLEKGNFWISADSGTAVIEHKQEDAECFGRIIEACAGIGAVGCGFHEVGVATACYCDINQTFCKWLQQKHATTPVIQGDIYDNKTIREVAETLQGRAMLSGGFACQPFSRLGDQRQNHDSRSRSMPGLLRMGFLLRCPIIVAECTREVLTSDWAQNILRVFGELTGYVIHQQILELHHTWPSLRTRWWSVISEPALGVREIPTLPKIGIQPCISDLFQLQNILSKQAMNELELDLYEARHFHSARGGIGSFMLNTSRQMQTATHALGTQLTHCHCGCRPSPFSLERLQSKGLYGILVSLNKMMPPPNDGLFALRHPHPQEVALLSGLDPTYLCSNQGFSLKFELGGVGQLASPIQGAWVLANTLKQCHEKHGITPQVHPHQVLADLCLRLIQSRFEVWDNQVENDFTDRFRQEFLTMREADFPKCTDQFTGADTKVLFASVSTSETTKVPSEVFNDSRPIIPSVSDVRVHSPRVGSVHSHDASDSTSAAEPVVEHPSVGHHAFVPGCTEAGIPVPNAVPVQAESHDPLQPGTLSPTSIASTAIAHHKRSYDFDEAVPAKRVHRETVPPAQDDKVYSENGGLSAFANRDAANWPTSSKTILHEPDSPYVEPTQEWTQPACSPDSLDMQILNFCQEPEENLLIWIQHENSEMYSIQCPPETTVGQVLVSEAKLLGGMELCTELKATTAVGSELSASSQVFDRQIIMIRYIRDDLPKCPHSKPHTELPQVLNMPWPYGTNWDG